MEKLKKILSPGKATEDEIMYGSSRSNDPVHSGNTGMLTGEGTHFDNSRDTPSGASLGSSNIGNAPTTAGPHSSDLANKADPRVDSDLDGSRIVGNTTGAYGSTGQSSMPGAFVSDPNPYDTQELDPRLGEPTTTSTSRAYRGDPSYTGTTDTLGHHYGRDAATGAGGVALAEHEHRKHERERESGLGSSGVEPSITDAGYNATSRSDIIGQSTTGTTNSHLGRDAAAIGAAGAVGEGIHHHRENERENLEASDGALGTYGDDAEVGNTSSNTTAGPHSSNLLNKLDPRVDSTSRTMGNAGSGTRYGRDAAAIGGAAAVGEGIHHHRENEHDNLGSSGYYGTSPAGTGSAYYGGPTGTAVSDVSGPHITSTAGRLDPVINQSGRPIEDAHEHRKHERERETGVGSTIGVGLNAGAYGDNSTYDTTTTTTGAGTTTGPHKSNLLNKLDPRVDSSNTGTMDNSRSDHHYGRDAAEGSGGVRLAEHEYRKHEREREAGIGSNTGAYNDDPAYTGTTGSTGHHYGRDAAVGAGGMGLAEQEHRKHERERETGVGSSTGVGSNTGAYGGDPNYTGTTGTTGHHYGQDAAVGAGGVGLAEHEYRKHEREREAGVGSNTGIGSTTGAYRDDPSYMGTTDTSGHHYGWDAAIGAGGLGLAEHEHRKHEREREFGLGGSTGTIAATDPSTGPAPNTAGPNSKDWMNKHDPRVKSNPDTADTGLTGSRGTTHRERDAVVGAGLAGAGYQAEKHRAARNEPGVGGAYDESLPDFHHTGRDASAIGAATALDENEKARLRAARGERDNNYDQGPLEPGYSAATSGPMNNLSPYEPGYNPATTGPMHQQSRDHHLGRDAAAAGVMGGTAYQAEKHYKHDKDLTPEEREQKRELKHEQKEEKKHHGFLSFLHRDKNKKYTKEEEEEFDRQEREHNNHAGRDAAVSGAEVGGAAYETEQLHGHRHAASGEPDTMKPLPVAPGNNGIGTGEGTQNALPVDRKRGEGYNMDTTGTEHPLAVGSDTYRPPGTTLGDKLHGVERNRGVNDGMIGAGYDSTTGMTGAGYDSTTSTTVTGTHHLGRDAAIGAEGVGLAEHEHQQHEEGTYPAVAGTSSDYSAPTTAKHNVLHEGPSADHPAPSAMAGGGPYPKDTTGTGNY